jgi:hypothetical protein
VTRAESRDENAEWYPYFLIEPDPRCRECVTIMDWRSAHREIVITNGTVAHHEIRVARERKERESKQHLHPVA